LSAGIAIVALDRARILLGVRFGVHADPRRIGNDDDDGDDDNEDDYGYTMATCRRWPRRSGMAWALTLRYPPTYHGDFERNVFDQVCSFGLEVSDFFIAICILRRVMGVQYAYCDAIWILFF